MERIPPLSLSSIFPRNPSPMLYHAIDLKDWVVAEIKTGSFSALFQVVLSKITVEYAKVNLAQVT